MNTSTSNPASDKLVAAIINALQLQKYQIGDVGEYSIENWVKGFRQRVGKILNTPALSELDKPQERQVPLVGPFNEHAPLPWDKVRASQCNPATDEYESVQYLKDAVGAICEFPYNDHHRDDEEQEANMDFAHHAINAFYEREEHLAQQEATIEQLRARAGELEGVLKDVMETPSSPHEDLDEYGGIRRAHRCPFCDAAKPMYTNPRFTMRDLPHLPACAWVRARALLTARDHANT